MAAAAAWLCLPRATAAAGLDAAIAALTAGRQASASDGLHLDLPARYDFGNTVPLTVAVDSPMTAADHVRRVAIFASGNPFPEVAVLHFTPDNGRASTTTRIRLNEGRQEVVAVAEMSDGRIWLQRRPIEVAISGCSAETGVVAGYAMPAPEPRLKLPAEVRPDQIVEISTMISHWMETGLRVDSDGHPIPRRIINKLTCLDAGAPIFTAELTPAIAANAYLSFPVMVKQSALLSFSWLEDGGAEYHASQYLKVS